MGVLPHTCIYTSLPVICVSGETLERPRQTPVLNRSELLFRVEVGSLPFEEDRGCPSHAALTHTLWL